MSYTLSHDAIIQPCHTRYHMTLSFTSCHHAWGGRGLLILIASSRLVQDDPELHDLLTKFFKLNKAKEDMNRKSKGVSAAEAEPGESADEGETSIATNIYSQYADPNNPDTWHHYELVKRAACSEEIVAGGSLTCFVSASRKAGGFVPAGNNRVRLCSCQGIEGS